VYSSATNVKKPRPYGGIPAEHIDPKAGRERKYVGNFFANTDLVEVSKLTYNTKNAEDPKTKRPMNTSHSWTFTRILPTRDDYNPDVWAPDVHPGQEVGQWIRSFQMFKGGDTRKINLILWDPYDSDYNRGQNPAVLLRNNINKAYKAGTAPAGSERLLFSKAALKQKNIAVEESDDSYDKFSTPLDYNKPNFFVRALVVQRGEVAEEPIKGLQPEDKPLLLDLGSQAGTGLITDFIKAGVEEHPYSFAIENGIYHCFFRKGDDPDTQDRFRKLELGYDVKTADRPEFPGPDLSDFHEILYPKLVPFSNVFYIYDDEQQAELIAQSFQWEPLEYAWRERKDYYNIAKSVHKPVTTVEMPATMNGTTGVVETRPAPVVPATPVRQWTTPKQPETTAVSNPPVASTATPVVSAPSVDPAKARASAKAKIEAARARMKGESVQADAVDAS